MDWMPSNLWNTITIKFGVVRWSRHPMAGGCLIKSLIWHLSNKEDQHSLTDYLMPLPPSPSYHIYTSLGGSLQQHAQQRQTCSRSWCYNFSLKIFDQICEKVILTIHFERWMLIYAFFRQILKARGSRFSLYPIICSRLGSWDEIFTRIRNGLGWLRPYLGCKKLLVSNLLTKIWWQGKIIQSNWFRCNWVTRNDRYRKSCTAFNCQNQPAFKSWWEK